MEINYKGIIYHFKQESNENNEMFYERCWKAINLSNKKPQTEEELNHNIKFSKLLINKKYYKCSYSTAIESKLKEIINQ